MQGAHAHRAGASRAWSSRRRGRRTRTRPTTSPSTASSSARPANIAVAVRAPAAGRRRRAGRLPCRRAGTGRDGARRCASATARRARLLMTSAPGTFRYRGRVCRDVSRLRPRAARRLHRARDPGGERRRAHPALRATATAPDARPATGSDRIAVVGADLRRDRLEPGRVAGLALDGLRARRPHPAAHRRRRRGGGRRGLAHEALERGDDRRRLLRATPRARRCAAEDGGWARSA